MRQGLQSGQQLIFNLDGSEVSVKKVLKSVPAWWSAATVQRRVDDWLWACQVRLPAELKPLRYLLATWTPVPAAPPYISVITPHQLQNRWLNRSLSTSRFRSLWTAADLIELIEQI